MSLLVYLSLSLFSALRVGFVLSADAVNPALLVQRGRETHTKNNIGLCCQFPKQTRAREKKREVWAYRRFLLRCQKKKRHDRPTLGAFFLHVSLFTLRLCGPDHCGRRGFWNKKKTTNNKLANSNNGAEKKRGRFHTRGRDQWDEPPWTLWWLAPKHRRRGAARTHAGCVSE